MSNPLYYLFDTAKNHLWYLYDLIGLYIAFPFIQAMVHHMDRRVENMFLVLWLILAGGGRLLTRVPELSSIDVGIEYMVPILQATYWLGYFISGYLLYKRKDDLKQKLSTPLLAAVFIGIAKELIRFPWASALYIPLLLVLIISVSAIIVWIMAKLPGLKKIVS